MLSQAVTCERAAGHPPMWRLMGASPLLPLPTFNLAYGMDDASEHHQSLRMRLWLNFLQAKPAHRRVQRRPQTILLGIVGDRRSRYSILAENPSSRDGRRGRGVRC